MTHPILSDPNTHATLATVSSGAATFLFWGLKVSDLGIMVSSLATVVGLIVQVCVFLETRRHNRTREEQDGRAKDADSDT